MCRVGSCCGALIFKKQCPVCRLMAYGVMALNLRGAVRFRAMTTEEFYRWQAPAFIGDEGVIVVGFRAVAKRILQELFMPNSWKRRNFIGPLNLPDETGTPVEAALLTRTAVPEA